MLGQRVAAATAHVVDQIAVGHVFADEENVRQIVEHDADKADCSGGS